MIWFNKNIQLKDLAVLGKNTMTEHLGLQFTEIGDDYLKATLPVDHRTLQPYGLLHGGASCVLAETLRSIASAFVIDHATYLTLGIEINANHLRSVNSGIVEGICKPIHLGNALHVWEIKITDEKGKLICVSRLTVMIKKR
ncbi:MAG: hotdog fold thioesterase [Fimbriimonadaceae bacterium]|nr:hotdog fold thioesterase [Chitinophagales bacterium]